MKIKASKSVDIKCNTWRISMRRRSELLERPTLGTKYAMETLSKQVKDVADQSWALDELGWTTIWTTPSTSKNTKLQRLSDEGWKWYLNDPVSQRSGFSEVCSAFQDDLFHPN